MNTVQKAGKLVLTDHHKELIQLVILDAIRSPKTDKKTKITLAYVASLVADSREYK